MGSKETAPRPDATIEVIGVIERQFAAMEAEAEGLRETLRICGDKSLFHAWASEALTRFSAQSEQIDELQAEKRQLLKAARSATKKLSEANKGRERLQKLEQDARDLVVDRKVAQMRSKKLEEGCNRIAKLTHITAPPGHDVMAWANEVVDVVLDRLDEVHLSGARIGLARGRNCKVQQVSDEDVRSAISAAKSDAAAAELAVIYGKGK